MCGVRAGIGEAGYCERCRAIAMDGSGYEGVDVIAEDSEETDETAIGEDEEIATEAFMEARLALIKERVRARIRAAVIPANNVANMPVANNFAHIAARTEMQEIDAGW